MITAFQKVKESPLWAKCLIASLALHSAALYVVIQNPVLLRKPWTSLFSPTTPVPKHISVDEEWNSDTLVLEHFFEEFPKVSKKSERLLDLASLAALLPAQEMGEAISINLRSSSSLKENELFQNSSYAALPSFDLKEEDVSPLIQASLSENPPLNAHYTPATFHDISFSFYGTKPLQAHHISTAAPALPKKEEVTLSLKGAESGASLEEQEMASLPGLKDPFSKQEETASLKPYAFNHFAQETPLESLTGASFSNIDAYFSEDLISAIEWNNDFDVKSCLFPQQDGYVFSLAITPSKNLEKQKIKQNFYFLIDTSADIEKHKLSVFKRSVSKALTSLKPGDSFNIFLVDKKTVKLSPNNLIVSPKNIALAEDFLEKKEEGRSFFTSLNLNQSLADLLLSVEAEDEVHTAILLTNGKATLPPKELRKFIEKNNGKVNLFTAAAGQNNHLTFLDLISSFSGGSLFYSDTNASFPRKLAAFVKGLEAPLAKNIAYSLTASLPEANVELSAPIQMPNLYNQTPFVIMGKMDRLCDLQLIIQGSSLEDQIFLKKVIHFEEASLPESSTKKQWLLHQKLELYEKFLKDPKPVHLEKATDILKTVHGKAFTQ